MQLSQADFPVVASTFPDAPITLPTSDLVRSTEVIEATESARPAWLTTPVLIGGALLLAFLIFRR